jgi:2-dehydropantoate 2-reductase
MPTRVCIVGCGALGSVIAAHLARVENVEVYGYDISEKNIRAINDHGLRISGAAELVVKVKATTRPEEIPPCDFGIVATKSIHTEAAIAQTGQIFGNTGAVCSVQNGIGNEEIIAKSVSQVIRGATTMAAHMIGPGHAGFEFYSELWIGPFEPAGTSYERVEQFAELLKRAGIRVVAMRDARGAQWTKFIFNCAANPVGALTRLHHGAATRFAPTGGLYEAILQEGEAVARAMGITLYGDPRKMIAEGANSPRKRNVSMLMDVLASQRTEVDFLNGAMADAGEKIGVPVPLNRALWQLVKGLEHSWKNPA